MGGVEQSFVLDSVLESHWVSGLGDPGSKPVAQAGGQGPVAVTGQQPRTSPWDWPSEGPELRSWTRSPSLRVGARPKDCSILPSQIPQAPGSPRLWDARGAHKIPPAGKALNSDNLFICRRHGLRSPLTHALFICSSQGPPANVLIRPRHGK